MKLFDAIFCSRYPPLRDVVRDVDTDFTVETMKQSVRAHASGVVAAIVVGKLCQGEQFGPNNLVLRRVGPKIVLNNPVENFTLTVRLRVVGGREAPLDDLYLT